MPKVYITKQEQFNNKLVSLIYGTMKVRRVTQSQMGTELGMSQQAFGKKLRGQSPFTFWELHTIFEKLEVPDEEILSVMRERK